MTSWDKRKGKLRKDFDHDPLITIPMIEGDRAALKVIQKRIREEFDKSKCENVTIIDQYFSPEDVEFVIHVFASYPERRVRVITRLEGVKGSDNKTKKECAFKEVVKEIKKKKIFRDFKVYKTNIPIHDRYFISDDISVGSPCFSLGTSLNMLFDKYTCLIKVENNAFKRQVRYLTEKCINNSKEMHGGDDD